MEHSLTRKLDKFFFWLLMFNPFLDVISGIYIRLSEMSVGKKFAYFALPVTPSLLIRMLVLVLFVFYLFWRKEWRSVGVLIPMGISWLLSVAGEAVMFYSFDLYADVQYMARFVYNICLLLVYAIVFKHCGLTKEELLHKLNKVASFTLLLLSSTIVLSYAFGIGYNTYADRFGYRGSRGFFYSGNDITAVMMILLPICICTYLQANYTKKKHFFFYSLGPAISIVALSLIGTKTAFLAIYVSMGVFLLYALVELLRTKKAHLLLRMLALAAVFAAVMGCMVLISKGEVVDTIQTSVKQPGTTLEQEGVVSAVLSGRQNKLKAAFRIFREGGLYTWLFGTGRGTHVQVIEMDVFEVLCYYGLLGLPVLLWLYVKLGLGFVGKFFRNINMRSISIFLALGLTAGYLFAAGHILFSVTSGFYFVFALLYGRLLFCDSPAQLEILPRCKK